MSGGGSKALGCLLVDDKIGLLKRLDDKKLKNIDPITENK